MAFSPDYPIKKQEGVEPRKDNYTPVEGENNYDIVPYILFLTYIFLAVMLVLSASYLLFVGGIPLSKIITGSENIYFYFLLLLFVVPGSNLLGIVIIILVIYAVFTGVVGLSFNSHVKPFDNPNGFFGMMAPFIFLLSAFIIAVESALNIPIGGPIYVSNYAFGKYSYFLNLIYAPIVEELGFRILPIGIVTFIPFILHVKRGGNSVGGETFKMNSLKVFALYILFPGYMRKKYGGANKYVDFTMIIVTSEFFAYAHTYFGMWSWGKLLPVFLVALILAVGYLKFGVYMDILLHFFLNDATGLVIAFPSSIVFIYLLVIFSAIVSLIAIAFSFSSMWRYFSASKNKEFFMKN